MVIGCQHSPTVPENATDTVVDDYGRTVAVPHSPTRIVSTSPAVTEIIFALGGDRLLVGRTQFCTYPSEAVRIENIGGISNLNVERIASLHPDLVISGSMIPERSIDQLSVMGVAAVCVIEQPTFDGLYRNIQRIGQLIGKKTEADSLTNCLREEVTSLTAKQDTGHSPTVYYVVGFGGGGNFTAGGNSFIDDIITMAGGRNIAHDMEGWNYGTEALLAQNPDYIIVRKEDSAAFCRMHPYTMLDAVKSGRVIAIESSTIDLQVPRNIDAIRFLQRRLCQQ